MSHVISLDKCIERADHTGILVLTGRNLRQFPMSAQDLSDLQDTLEAGECGGVRQCLDRLGGGDQNVLHPLHTNLTPPPPPPPPPPHTHRDMHRHYSPSLHICVQACFVSVSSVAVLCGTQQWDPENQQLCMLSGPGPSGLLEAAALSENGPLLMWFTVVVSDVSCQHEKHPPPSRLLPSLLPSLTSPSPSPSSLLPSLLFSLALPFLILSLLLSSLLLPFLLSSLSLPTLLPSLLPLYPCSISQV